VSTTADVPVYQLDGFYNPQHPGDCIIDPDGDGYGVLGGSDVAEHWRSGPSRLVRVHIRLDAEREPVVRLLRDMLDWFEREDNAFDWRDDETLGQAIRRDQFSESETLRRSLNAEAAWAEKARGLRAIADAAGHCALPSYLDAFRDVDAEPTAASFGPDAAPCGYSTCYPGCLGCDKPEVAAGSALA